jgi:hypothetical protein
MGEGDGLPLIMDDKTHRDMMAAVKVLSNEEKTVLHGFSLLGPGARHTWLVVARDAIEQDRQKRKLRLVIDNRA